MVALKSTEEILAAHEARIADLEARLNNVEAPTPTPTEESPIPIPEKGTPISMRQVQERYGVSPHTVSNWRDLEWIATIDPGKGEGSRCLVDEHDVVLVLLDRANRPGRGVGRKAREKIGLAS